MSLTLNPPLTAEGARPLPAPPDVALAAPSGWKRRRWRRAALTAVFASIGLHLAILVMLGQIRLPVVAVDAFRELTTAITEELPLEESLPDPILALAEPSDEPTDSPLAAAQGAIAPTLSEEPTVIESIEPVQVADADLSVPRVEQLNAQQLDQVLVQTGGVGDHVATAEGAVDRIVYEIALNLAESDVLVIWLMDSSTSLYEQRQTVADRLEEIYRELGELDEVTPGALKAAVVRYGHSSEVLVEPTDDGARVCQAIRDVPNDPSGEENVFSCIVRAANLYKPLRSRQGRKLMIFNWTDEAGDDDAQLEDAVDVCRRLAIPVYTVGASSMFGRREGRQRFRHPESGRIYFLPIARGPDTVRPELAKIPFWFNDGAGDLMTCGLGPYALTRLARETGGAYFIHDAEPPAERFELATMRRYLPDYRSPQEYARGLRESRLRQAVVRAVDLTLARELRGTPRLEFAPTAESYQAELREAQETAAFNALTVEQALVGFGDKGLEAEYADEPSPRWRAWYDLTFGRLLAMRVRASEYNLACAELKAKGAEFVNTQSNRWRFQADAALGGGTAVEKQAAEAQRLLQRCIESNPGTPWAALAARELEHPLGFKLIEAFVPPPPQVPQVVNNNPNEPQGRRQEQVQMLRREEESLPKL